MTAHERQRAAHRLKIDVVLEESTDDAFERPRILPERGVFQLDDVDIV